MEGVRAYTNYKWWLIFVLVILPLPQQIFGSSQNSKNEDEWSVGFKVGAGVVVGAASIVAIPVVLSVVGFTGAGVAAGSIAASVQSGIGAVSAGSIFAGLQSIGAAGLGVASKVLIGLGAGTLGLVAVDKLNPTNDTKENTRSGENWVINKLWN